MNAPFKADTAQAPPYDVEALRAEFPILSAQVYGKPLVYLDNAASAQKPREVIAAMVDTMEGGYSNVHRGLHYMANAATEAFEEARETVRRFLNAGSTDEIVFTRSATEAINLVADSYGRLAIGGGGRDHRLHHGAPFERGALAFPARATGRGDQMGAGRRRRQLPPRGIREAVHGEDQDRRDDAYVERARHGDADGRGDPHRPCARRAGHGRRQPGRRASRRRRQALDADFYVFTGHKVYGPTGSGVLYGKREWLERMPPYQGGGEMIETVTCDRVTYGQPPHRFEAGTPAIVEAIGLGAALRFMERVGRPNIRAHEATISAYAHERLGAMNSIRIIGRAKGKGPILSFEMQGAHAHDVATIIDRQGVAVRAGTHCAMPLLERFGATSTCRASFGLYNTMEEVDKLAEALAKAETLFA